MKGKGPPLTSIYSLSLSCLRIENSQKMSFGYNVVKFVVWKVVNNPHLRVGLENVPQMISDQNI